MNGMKDEESVHRDDHFENKHFQQQFLFQLRVFITYFSKDSDIQERKPRHALVSPTSSKLFS